MVNVSSFDSYTPATLRKPLRLRTPVYNSDYDMVVFCHLRWEFVYQRPQHIISRLARERRILLIEEPVPFAEEERNTAVLREVSANLHVLQPKVGSIEEIKGILPRYLGSGRLRVGWFYSPAFLPLLRHVECDTLVYDCMDELSLFRGAAGELPELERQLMAKADLVFTGGKSLYEAKRGLHDDIHCFPSSVDQVHFARAHEEQPLPEDIRAIHASAPIVGFFGVLDERIDFGLLAAAAQRNPEVAFVMIGPLAKIGEHDLPRNPNIHYLGMKPYEQLPAYLRAFTLAMMPFAANDATRFISPTKTLEYIAAGKPVISTPIRDVVRDYSHCVSIVSSADEFATAVQMLLAQDPAVTTAAYESILARTSWDSTVSRMNSLLSARAIA